MCCSSVDNKNCQTFFSAVINLLGKILEALAAFEKSAIRRISGMPVSSFIAYSKKHKNKDIPIKSRKTKKRRSLVAEAIAGQQCMDLTENNTSSTETSPVKALRPPSKKKRAKELKKNGKYTLSNGHSSPPKAAEASDTPPKAKASPKKPTIQNLCESSDSESFPEEEDNLDISEARATPSEVNTESNEARSQNKKDESSAEDNVDATSAKTATNDAPKLDKSPKRKLVKTIPKSVSKDPMEEARGLFEWLISPVSVENFFKNNWEKTPLHIKRTRSNYFKLLMSTPMMDTVLRDFYVLYTKNIDITSYSNGQRETHNPQGRARPSVVWDYYSNGCSIRMLNPQTFIPRLHSLNATLQEFFGCFVGSNSYLTPPDSQGFAPHYDDIEAFILQIEGKKRWRLYKPPTEAEYLSRYSSKNFDPEEIGEPVLDTVVNAGDLLYFPRGTIHQGETIDGCHSLHLTLSVYQKNSWCDFLEKLIPEALNLAVQSDTGYREGLPIDYLRHVGAVHSEKDTEIRRNFIDKTKELLHGLIDYIDVDKVADQMGKICVHDFLPPTLMPQELACSVIRDGERITSKGEVENRVEIEPDTRIRLLRSHCVRLVEEEDTVRLYYSTENSKEYHEYEPQFLEVDSTFAPAIEQIIHSYPEFIRVDDLPIEGEDNRVQVARDLWEKCIVVTDAPLPVID